MDRQSAAFLAPPSPVAQSPLLPPPSAVANRCAAQSVASVAHVPLAGPRLRSRAFCLPLRRFLRRRLDASPPAQDRDQAVPSHTAAGQRAERNSSPSEIL